MNTTARYHRIRTASVARTVEIGKDWFFVDVDRDGRIVGLEVLGDEDPTALLYALADHDGFTFGGTTDTGPEETE